MNSCIKSKFKKPAKNTVIQSGMAVIDRFRETPDFTLDNLPEAKSVIVLAKYFPFEKLPLVHLPALS